MGISFTQYLRPDGRRSSTIINRPNDIEHKAEQLEAVGAYFESEVLRNGIVSMTCMVEDQHGNPETLGHVLCENGPAVLEQVDILVKSAREVAIQRGFLQLDHDGQNQSPDR
jgi:hypothetical protein